MADKANKKIKLIIADDDIAVRRAFRKCIENSGYEIVAEASDGMSAVSMAREMKADMAVLDIAMPAMDGLAASKVMLEEGLVHCTVMLTSFETEDYVESAIKCGAEGYVTKPFYREQLLSVLDTSFAESREKYLLKKDCVNLKKKIESKELANKAKLIIMESKNLDENGAYTYLREMSKRKGISVETVAELIIAEWENRIE
ncbi:MAG: response regulator [Oscillospiraceae bacterium]|nr:response regulator [Oscillospiraceae bacterium]